MAEITVSQHASKVNENSAIQMEYMDGSTPAVLSTEVARRFQRKHTHILRDIDRIRSQVPKIFFETNFGFNEYEISGGFGIRKERRYFLTRDAFSLLVMGFTGSAAIRWKLAYIEAFNSLEVAVLHNQTELAHEAGFQQGLDAARSLPAAEATRKAAYLDGMKEGVKLQKRNDGLARLVKIHGYLRKGLTHREIGKILGVTRQAVTDTLARARKLMQQPETTAEVKP